MFFYSTLRNILSYGSRSKNVKNGFVINNCITWTVCVRGRCRLASTGSFRRYVLYSDHRVNLGTATADNTPRLIVCLPSVSKIHSLTAALVAPRSWNLCLDEIGQTRGMTASAILDAVKMKAVDTALQRAVVM